jgi:hypothetical protein
MENEESSECTLRTWTYPENVFSPQLQELISCIRPENYPLKYECAKERINQCKNITFQQKKLFLQMLNCYGIKESCRLSNLLSTLLIDCA